MKKDYLNILLEIRNLLEIEYENENDITDAQRKIGGLLNSLQIDHNDDANIRSKLGLVGYGTNSEIPNCWKINFDLYSHWQYINTADDNLTETKKLFTELEKIINFLIIFEFIVKIKKILGGYSTYKYSNDEMISYILRELVNLIKDFQVILKDQETCLLAGYENMDSLIALSKILKKLH